MKRSFQAALVAIVCLSALVTYADNGGNNGGDSSEEKTLVLGFSRDGRPVSYPAVDWSGRLRGVRGFCADVAHFLRRQGYRLKLQPLFFDERFEAFARRYLPHGEVGIQCGPSSRTRERAQRVAQEHGVFSIPFAVTSTKLLIRRERLDRLYPRPYKERGILRIGVLDSPAKEGLQGVTSVLIGDVIPNAVIVALSSRQQAIERLRVPLLREDGQPNPEAIDAYASDEIILAEMKRNELASQREQYVIEPPGHGYSQEEYALVLFNAPAELREAVNAWLVSPQGRQAVQRFLPDSGATSTYPSPLGARVGFVLLGLLLGWWVMRRHQQRLGVDEGAAASTPVGPAPASLVLPEPDSLPASVDRLTPREREVLVLLVAGNSNKEVARELDVSPRTVETHRRNIYTKLGVSSPYELVDYARLLASLNDRTEETDTL